MSVKLKKINDIVIKPLQRGDGPTQKVKGEKFFSEAYANIFLCAKKKSGKTNLIWTILKNCASKDTKIVIFCATVERDTTYKQMIEFLEQRGNPVVTYMSITEERTDVLKEMLTELRNNGEESLDGDDVESTNPFPFIRTMEDGMAEEARKKKKKKKSKYLAPEIIFVFDDLSRELRKTSVSMLLKSNRHYKCKTIVSSQFPNDLQPESLKQLDYCILFSGHDVKKLEKFHNDLDLSIPLDKFIDIYLEATNKKYSFLYIDTVNETFRKNMNHEIEINI
jgi:hypothetical protein